MKILEIKKEIHLSHIENIVDVFPFEGKPKFVLSYCPQKRTYIIDIYDKQIFLYETNKNEKAFKDEILITSIFVSSSGYVTNINYLTLMNQHTRDFCFKLLKLIGYRIVDIQKQYEVLSINKEK